MPLLPPLLLLLARGGMGIRLDVGLCSPRPIVLPLTPPPLWKFMERIDCLLLAEEEEEEEAVNFFVLVKPRIWGDRASLAIAWEPLVEEGPWRKAEEDRASNALLSSS